MYRLTLYKGVPYGIRVYDVGPSHSNYTDRGKADVGMGVRTCCLYHTQVVEEDNKPISLTIIYYVCIL